MCSWYLYEKPYPHIDIYLWYMWYWNILCVIDIQRKLNGWPWCIDQLCLILLLLSQWMGCILYTKLSDSVKWFSLCDSSTKGEHRLFLFILYRGHFSAIVTIRCQVIPFLLLVFSLMLPIKLSRSLNIRGISFFNLLIFLYGLDLEPISGIISFHTLFSIIVLEISRWFLQLFWFHFLIIISECLYLCSFSDEKRNT